MPKKTIYIREADVPLWEQAELRAAGDSVSGVLTEALRRYLDGQQAVVGHIVLAGCSQPFRSRVQALSNGWMVALDNPGVQDVSDNGAIVEVLATAGVLPDGVRAHLHAPYSGWIWLASANIQAIMFSGPPTAEEVDYLAQARVAWSLLRQRAPRQQPITYGDLGQLLGGLHPLHEVPKVLDVIAQWCVTHQRPDLTGLVISKSTGLPGHDYWRLNGWEELVIAERVERWRQSLSQLAKNSGPENPPF